LLERLAHFVLPPVMLTGAISMALFYGALLLRLLWAGAIAHPLAPAPLIRLYTPEVPVAQTALVTFLVLSGLLLVVFVAPPTAWWTGAATLRGDRRPAALAVSLMVTFVVVSVTPPLRALFALSPLGLMEIGLVAAALGAWLLLVRWTWRQRLLARFVGARGHGRDGCPAWEQKPALRREDSAPSEAL
jgi:cation-transporting ATPase E